MPINTTKNSTVSMIYSNRIGVKVKEFISKIFIEIES